MSGAGSGGIQATCTVQNILYVVFVKAVWVALAEFIL